MISKAIDKMEKMGKNMDDIILEFKKEYERFEEKFLIVNKQYEKDCDIEKLEISLRELAQEFAKNSSVSMAFSNYGETLILKGQKDVGILYFKIALESFEGMVDEITIYLRMAEYHIEKGEIDIGRTFLLKLCEDQVANFKEALAFRKLTPVWNKYKHLVADHLLRVSNSEDKNSPLSPEECSMQIREILQLPEDQMISELSIHLNEMSCDGEAVNYLNKWERIFFYLDSLCTDINADGLEHFVDYHGHRLKQTQKAMEDFYYEFVEKDLLAKLYQFVLDNQKNFR